MGQSLFKCHTSPALVWLKSISSPLLLLGAPNFRLKSGSWLREMAFPQEPPLPMPWVFYHNPLSQKGVPSSGHTRGGLCSPNKLNQSFHLPHQGIYLMLLIFQLLGQLFFLGGGNVADAVFAFTLAAALTCPAFPSSSDFLHSSKKCI